MMMKIQTPADVLRREEAKAKREALELHLARDLTAHRIKFLTQYEFWPGRKWRFDFAIMRMGPYMLAIEVQGGIFSGGRHTRGAALEDEYEKLAHAAIRGWTVMPVSGGQIKSGKAIDWIRKALRMT